MVEVRRLELLTPDMRKCAIPLKATIRRVPLLRRFTSQRAGLLLMSESQLLGGSLRPPIARPNIKGVGLACDRVPWSGVRATLGWVGVSAVQYA